jgi:beta-1,4-N-acetylglucosaminyltransferase
MILVTIGTTSFDALIEQIDTSFPKEIELIFQKADGKYNPVNFPFFTFTKNIDEYYHQSEIIICHAGAGTIYKLLEMGKKLIVAPNMTRSDPHQKEMAEFIEKNKYGVVCWDMEDILFSLKKVTSFKPIKYQKPKFSGGELLLQMINQL